jgi:N-acetyl-gamma-glutamyl-phosphate reductase
MDASAEEVAKMVDVVFLALPHGTSMQAAPVFLKAGKKVVDLSADFRLRDVKLYEKWYEKHSAPKALRKAVYGIPELYRNSIKKADFVANPGCYPTSVILGTAPVLKGNWIDETSIIVDSKSGVSGAGREPQIGSLFCEVASGFQPYKVGGRHRHLPEMEQELSVLAGHKIKVSFTPHLLPISRGILSTIYAPLKKKCTPAQLTEFYKTFYHDEKFIRIYKTGTFPNISFVRGSNYCDIGVTVDTRTNMVIIVSAIDNLIKGASGQAIQNMNIVCGFPEETGLGVVSLFP